jgi:pimeloyl-ACP methyl ester carboxylesterase
VIAEQALSRQVSATPVVLLHSSMSSKAQWKRMVQALEPARPTLAIDLYGYGEAPLPASAEDFALADEVERVRMLIEQRFGHATPFHLIGHSYGGATALRLASEMPQRIASLAVFEPVAFYLLEADDPARQEVEAVVQRIDQAIPYDRHAATRTFIDYWSGAGTFDAMPDNLQALLADQIGKVRLDFQALMSEPLRLPDLSVLSMPVCLLRGKQSPLSTRRIVELLSLALPQAVGHESDGGHMAPITHAEQVNALLLGFLTELDGTAKSALREDSIA